MDNLELWNKVCVTDLDHTKKTKLGGRQVTVIDPQYQLKTATEQFGPYGLNFGIVPNSVAISYKVTDEENPITFLMYDATMFYMLDGRRAELPVSAVQRFSYTTKSYGAKAGYFTADEDAQRKAETNAMSKALSRIGFNSDVFMGQLDDKAYIDNLKAEQSIEKAENKEETEKEQRENIKEYMESAISDLSIKEVGLREVKNIYKEKMAYLDKRSKLPLLAKSCQYSMNEITKVYNKRIEENDKPV